MNHLSFLALVVISPIFCNVLLKTAEDRYLLVLCLVISIKVSGIIRQSCFKEYTYTAKIAVQ